MLIEVFCDGASRGQGQKKIGEAACSVIVYKNRKKIAQFARGLGPRNNNEAEYEAVISGLLICSMAELYDPIIYTDSAVVANQINGKWQCQHNSLIPLLMTIEDIKDEFNFKVVQVERSFVWEPDALCNEFLDKLEERKTKFKKPVV
jgi:ribonuclease HI